MYKHKHKPFAILTALLLLALAGTSSAGPVTNGSFEEGQDPGSQFILLSGGSTAITGWTVLPTNIHYVGGYWTSADGTRSLDLNGNVAGGIQQVMTTVPGTEYLLEFDMAGNPAGGPTIKSMDVAVGSQITSFSFDITGKTLSNMGWQNEQLTFVADSDATTLQFVSTIPGEFGPALDNVRVTPTNVPPTPPTPIPVPGAALLTMLGVGLLTGARVRLNKML